MFSNRSCVITMGKYQSVNNPCHSLPFYAITVFWSCGLASFTKDSSIQMDYCSVCYTAEGQPECMIWSTYYELSAINCDQYSSVKSTSKAEMLKKYYFKWTGRGIWPSVIQPLLHCCARKHSALPFMKQLWCLQLENANLLQRSVLFTNTSFKTMIVIVT